MYRKLLVMVATIVVTCCPLLCAAKAPEVQEIPWNIAREPSISARLEPGTYRLVVSGMVRGNYRSQVTVDTIPIPGLPQVSAVTAPFKAAGPKPALAPVLPGPPNPCLPYEQMLSTLRDDALDKFHKPDLAQRGAEEQFAFALLMLESAIKTPSAGCSADPESLNTLRALVEASKVELTPITVERGQIVKAEISRPMGEASGELKFTYEGNTGKRGSWQSSYGFGITPNNDRHYFSEAADNDTFVITQKRDNGGYQPNAAVFYTWLPAAWENKYLSFGIAGGIGVDQNNLVLLLGPHITFNQNLGLVVGIALHQETRLRGEYDVSQVLAENLTSDALEEKVHETTWFVGLTYRFGEPAK